MDQHTHSTGKRARLGQTQRPLHLIPCSRAHSTNVRRSARLYLSPGLHAAVHRSERRRSGMGHTCASGVGPRQAATGCPPLTHPRCASGAHAELCVGHIIEHRQERAHGEKVVRRVDEQPPVVREVRRMLTASGAESKR